MHGTSGSADAAGELQHEIVVGDERPRDAHRVAIASRNGVLDDRRRLKPAGADDRDVANRLLDGVRVGPVEPFDLVLRAARATPSAA